jgi:multicomponent Na+:H+ antiporter subunit B
MKDGAHPALAAAAQFYAPLIVLFALALLVTRAAGAGVGFVGGLALLLALIVHALVFGAAAARAAAPPLVLRLLAAAGLVAAVFGWRAPGAPQLVEAGLLALTAAGGALALTVLIGRAPTMRDQDS